MYTQDPAFWRAGAISVTIVMAAVLLILTIDTLHAMSPGGSHVPPYTVINQHIDYKLDASLGRYMPIIGGEELLFGHKYTPAEADALIARGKLVIQSRACMDCHTFFGNGAYYGPDLTKSWLDPIWMAWQGMYQGKDRADAMVKFLVNPDKFPLGPRAMANLHIERDEAEALVAYLKWMSAVDTNGFPDRFAAR